MLFSRRIVPAYAAACGLLVAGAVGFASAVRSLEYYLVKEPVALRAPLDSLPTALGSWQRYGTDPRFSDDLVEELGTRQYLQRIYVKDGEPKNGAIELHLAYYTGTIDDVPHVPERCWNVHGLSMTRAPQEMTLQLSTSGWTPKSGVTNRATGLEYASAEATDPITGRGSQVYLPVGETVMTVTEFQDPKRPKDRLVGGYFFIANGRITPNAYGVRALAYERTDRFAYYCKVQISMRGTVRDDNESLLPRFQAAAEEVLSVALPHIMRRLPDWPSIEKLGPGEEPPAAPQ